ncbi:clathrin coat assembly protein AP180-like [Pistacia vera]|uniref:clathrin coat assembly protein AP180-like n=1 Tax=Pistacia vera TaxID=55513 RepID=UPI001263BDD6|nr:clathrin coat assembly protein AP180-like [Pistacia vera]
MPSKLKKAIGAVKDQTSIGLAKVSKSTPSNVEVIILKATRHDEIPVDDRYLNELLQLISSNKVHVVACAQVIAKRIGRTRNWIVALKSLMLILKIFHDGDPFFPREISNAMKRGHKILNLTNFRDDSKSSPWDYTAFVRTFAIYLDERLDCFLSGKLQRRYTNREKENGGAGRCHKPVTDMKPTLLIDRISSWQRLLDRAIGTRPTGAAKSNKLVQISLYAIVQESFDLYRDISDALALLLDNFFHLQYESCASAFQACVKASKQFEELCSFYALCKSIGIGRTSEYPSVQKVSDELIETLKEFLKDQASFPRNRSRSPVMLLPAPPVPDNKDPCSSSSEPGDEYICDQSSGPTERESEFDSLGTSPSASFEQYCSSSRSDQQEYDNICTIDTISNHSMSLDQCKDMTLDILFLDDCTTEEHNQQQQHERNEWELMLAETATQQQSETLTNASISDNFIHQTNSSPDQQPYNPFLQDAMDVSTTVNSEQEEFQITTDTFSAAPTFRATPTFEHNVDPFTMAMQIEDDPFESCMGDNHMHINNGSPNNQIVLHEQQLWLQNQNKIIAKRMA